MTKYVLVGTQRSGTTLLRTMLDSHPEILCLGETFYINKYLIYERNARQNTNAQLMGMIRRESFTQWKEHSYKTYLSKSIRRQLMHVLMSSRTIDQYLDKLYATEGYDAIGYKVMMNQMRKFPNILPYIKNNDVRVIHILRKNVFSILLSALTMKARGYSHSPIGGTVVKINIPTNNLENRLYSIQQEGEQLIELFKHDSPYMMITYEEFIRNKDQYASDMLNFLGVDSDVALSSELVKLNTAPVSDYVENIDDVRRCLSGTRFSWCIEELL